MPNGIQPPAVTVPTISEIGRLLLMLIMGISALVFMTKRNNYNRQI